MVLAPNSFYSTREHLQGSDLTCPTKLNSRPIHKASFSYLEESAIEFVALSYFHSKQSSVLHYVSDSDKRSLVYSADTSSSIRKLHQLLIGNVLTREILTLHGSNDLFIDSIWNKIKVQRCIAVLKTYSLCRNYKPYVSKPNMVS